MVKTKKENVVIFGASEGGKNFINKQSDFKILAVADNDTKKVGLKLECYLIISPNEILNYSFDYVVVTSMYFNPIKKQLIELGVDENKIVATPKHLLKSVEQPFQNYKTLEFAQNVLLKLTEIFKELSINYFVDFGTLLGIVRDGELISWDDDIDFSIPSYDLSKLLNGLNRILSAINMDVTWEYNIIYNIDKTVSNLVLNFKDVSNIGIKPFAIDLWVIYFKQGFAIQTMNKVSDIHFLENDRLTFKGEVINVPKDYINYLEHTYGDWKVPKKNTTFADYPFAFTD